VYIVMVNQIVMTTVENLHQGLQSRGKKEIFD
jgi:hypothetical protein